MNKRKIGKVLVVLSLAMAAKAEAISLESKTVIEEIRTRLNKVVEIPVTEPEVIAVKSDEYIPGQDLKNALTRLRSGLYGSAGQDKNPALPVRASVTVNLESDYQPGALLSRSLDKIRSQREIARMIKLINAVKTVPQFPPMVKTHAPTPRPEPETVVDAAPPVDVIEPSAADASPVSETESFQSEPAVVDRKNSSAELLREVRLKLDRKLSHEKAETAKDEPEADAEIPAAKKEDEDINSEISTFEFKMPANYRIIVR